MAKIKFFSGGQTHVADSTKSDVIIPTPSTGGSLDIIVDGKKHTGIATTDQFAQADARSWRDVPRGAGIVPHRDRVVDLTTAAGGRGKGGSKPDP